jgi:hypothetical protein
VSELISAPEDPQGFVEASEHVIECVRQPVVITEQAVAFSTAAAVPLPRTKPSHKLIAALRAMFPSSSEDAPPARRHYPPRRDTFFEEAAMEREMHRL